MKSLMIASVAGVAGLAAAASVPTLVYSPLSNPGTGKCIVTNDYDADSDTWTLTLGDCSMQTSDGLALASDPSTGHLVTVDGTHCVITLANSSNKGYAVVLAPCTSESGAKWTAHSSTSQWRNGHNLCLDYNGDSESMVQNTCQSAPLPMGSMQQYVFTNMVVPPPIVPPTPPAQQSCGSWSVANGGPVNSCGSGMTYTASDSQMCNADGSNCQAACCSPARTTMQTCGQWAVKYGGSPNACGDNMMYTASDADMCDLSGDNCMQNCCSPKLY